MKEMTKSQAKVYRYISRFLSRHRYAPTREEISAKFGWSSANAANCHLVALEKKRKIKLDGRAHRNIVVL